ncbi:MAG: GGDEF domain-containing protein [Planctomycetota bacterium]|jgi:diguanylate cyclase (GGDEF)-like protein
MSEVMEPETAEELEKPVLKKVLMVDDDKDICSFVTKALGYNYDITTVSDPYQVEYEVERIKPDLLLLDENMPGRHGVDICRSLRENSMLESLPVLFVSALTHSEKTLDYYAAGANDVISKPFDLPELRARISVWLSVYERRKKLSRKNTELIQLSRTDALTGLINRRYCIDLLDHEFSRHQRYGNETSLLFIDINNFKKANDTYGHLFGDQVLREFSRQLQEVIRESDTAVRYGGDEFMVILPETNHEQAKEAIKRLKNSVKKNPLSDKEDLQIGISVGLSSLNKEIYSVSEWIETADKNMYIAKMASHAALKKVNSEDIS